jgi:hypothetical protein
MRAVGQREGFWADMVGASAVFHAEAEMLR